VDGFVNVCDTDLDGITFDSATGEYTFSSEDMETYSPGDYKIRITGTVVEGDSISDSIDFVMTLVDPCPTASLTLKQSPFSDAVHYLRDGTEYQEWQFSALVSSSTNVNCGAYGLTFHVSPEPGSGLFLDDRTVEPYRFTVQENTDKDLRGEYKVTYTVFYVDYDTVTATNETPFTIDIVERCEQPLSIKPSDDTSLES
jgi:hypothetical protein